MALQIVGLADPATFPTDPSMFTEIAVADTLVVPEAKPPVEQLTTVVVQVTIDSIRLIQTPSGRSLGGQILRGMKVAIEGTIKQKVLYVADAPDQPVHAFEGAIPFSTFIVVSSTVDRIPIGELLPSIEVTPFVEDVYVRLISPYSVFKNVIILLNVTVTPPIEVPPVCPCPKNLDA